MWISDCSDTEGCFCFERTDSGALSTIWQSIFTSLTLTVLCKKWELTDTGPRLLWTYREISSIGVTQALTICRFDQRVDLSDTLCAEIESQALLTRGFAWHTFAEFVSVHSWFAFVAASRPRVTLSTSFSLTGFTLTVLKSVANCTVCALSLACAALTMDTLREWIAIDASAIAQEVTNVAGITRTRSIFVALCTLVD